MKTITRFFHFLFVPSSRNNYRARVLHHDSLTTYLAILVLLLVLVRYNATPVGKVLGVATDINVEKLLEYTNQERANHSLQPLSYNTQLANAAFNKAQDMFTQNYWAHFAPDGKTPWDFINGSGYKYEVAGENLAKNFLYSQNVVTAWMNSPSHRENILRPEFTDVGFAVANGTLNGEETTLVVQMFGKPYVAVAQPTVVPQQKIEAKAEVPVLGKDTIIYSQSQVKPSFTYTPYILYGFIGFLVLALAIDFYVATRLHVVRLHGKNMAHMIFFITVAIAAVAIVTKGAIL